MSRYEDEKKEAGYTETGWQEEADWNGENSCREYNNGEKEQEYALRIMEALSGVDEELLEKSSRRVSRNSIWRLAGTWAAVLGLMAVGAASWGGYQLMRGSGADGTGAMDACPQAINPFEENEAEGPEAAEGENAMPESMAADEAAEDFCEGEEPGTAEAAQDQDSEAGDEPGDGNSMRENEASDGEKTSDEYNKAMDGENKQNNEAETGDTPREDTDSSGSGGKEGDAGRAEADGISEETSSCVMPNVTEYTEREARELEEIGGYIPDALPGGYEFSRAYSNQDSEEPNLTVSWTRGMDSIILHLEITDRELRTVDVEKRETYDERLYEIPYAETVPAQYREIFNDPVFSLGDMDLEIVKSRMKEVQDNGDNAVPRGNFQVLYPGNVLISFNGRGTAEEIWEMFCSIGEDGR